VGMAATAILRAGLTWLQRQQLLRLETKLALASSYRFFRHVLRLPVEFFTHRYGGEVGARVALNDRAARLLSRALPASLLNVLMAGAYVALMFSFDVVLALVGLAVAGLNFLALRQVSRRRKDTNAGLLQERAKLMGTNMSGLVAIETLKATGSESDFFSRWSGQLARGVGMEQRLAGATPAPGAGPPPVAALDAAATLGLGARRVRDGHMTVGTLVASQSLMLSSLEPVNQLVQLGGSLQEVEGEMNRLDDVLRYPIDPNVEKDP